MWLPVLYIQQNFNIAAIDQNSIYDKKEFSLLAGIALSVAGGPYCKGLSAHRQWYAGGRHRYNKPYAGTGLFITGT
ncbi:hypothetical protein GCM10011379_38150 [Filimonas zeae]|uniref:Uncharacterized protein n=1 Tax=Filimonas zeae TaxID=1737353 RepID=A0A917MXT2_9BACT|nr:hypothetical protein GCM10011379_38150 [Filimonas zeae]